MSYVYNPFTGNLDDIGTSSTGTSAKYSTGSFVISGLGISGLQSGTIVIPLNANDYTLGDLFAYVPAYVGTTDYQRQWISLYFTTDQNDAYSRANSLAYYTVYGYIFPDFRVLGFDYRSDNRLSLSGTFQNGAAGMNTVTSCVISGGSILLTITNIHSTTKSTLSANGVYHVFKQN
jgi:hypothetical protein